VAPLVDFMSRVGLDDLVQLNVTVIVSYSSNLRRKKGGDNCVKLIQFNFSLRGWQPW
jgi:hypothetical protein